MNLLDPPGRCWGLPVVVRYALLNMPRQAWKFHQHRKGLGYRLMVPPNWSILVGKPMGFGDPQKDVLVGEIMRNKYINNVKYLNKMWFLLKFSYRGIKVAVDPESTTGCA